MAERQEPGARFDDLFEDLDKFFAPIDEVRIPEEAEHPAAAPPAAPPPAPAAERPPAVAGPFTLDHAPSPAPTPAGDQEDVVPEGWVPEVEEGEGREPPTERPTEPAPQAPEGAPTVRRPVPPPSPTPPGPEADWGRLRGVLGEEGSAGQAEDVEVGRGPIEQEVVEEPSGGEGAREITLEDLRKPPPEYANLPGPDEPIEPIEPIEPRLPEELAGPAASEGPRRDQFVLDRPAPAEPAEPAASSGPPDEERVSEPSIEEVEEVAGRLAREFGTGEVPPPGGVEDDLLVDLARPAGPRTVKVGQPEELLGSPTWEEGAGGPFGGTPPVGMGGPGPSRGRNLSSAFFTAVALVVVAVVAIVVSKAAFAVVATVVVLIGQAELYATMQRNGYQPATALGLVMGALVMAGAYLKGEPAMVLFVALGLVLSFLWYMAGPPKTRENAVGNIGATMLGVVYAPFLAGFVLIILSQAVAGRSLAISVLGLAFFFDIVAFFFGTWWGSRALAPSISPRKSWEGVAAAAVATFVVAIAILPTAVKELTLARAALLAVVVSVLAPLGDLAESAIKRDLGVKDMGSILPGHGGVLDRIDSVLFVAPAAFYLFRLMF